MNRRGFLGFFGAGVAAGPKLAAGIAQDVAMLPPMPPVGGYACAQSVKEDVGWRVRQIARLKTVIRSKDPEARQREVMLRLHMAENGERLRIDGLRSVSPAHKHNMLVESLHQRQERIRRADAGFDLARLLSGED